MRVLKWVVDRVQDRAAGHESPLGRMPGFEDLTWQGLDFDRAAYERLMAVPKAEALTDAEAQKAHLDQFAGHLPAPLEEQRQAQIKRLEAAPEVWRLPD